MRNRHWSGCEAGPTRRTFVKGLALGGAAAGLGFWPPSAWASTDTGRPPTELTGTEFDLAVGETPMNVTGSPPVGLDRERLGPRADAAVA